jgi:hypothetical protein
MSNTNFSTTPESSSKPYHAPSFTVYGSVSELTNAAAGMAVNTDADMVTKT